MQETKREICTTHEHTEGKKSQVRISTPTLFSHCLLPCSACSAHTQGSAHGQYSKQLSSLPKRKKNRSNIQCNNTNTDCTTRTNKKAKRSKANDEEQGQDQSSSGLDPIRSLARQSE